MDVYVGHLVRHREVIDFSVLEDDVFSYPQGFILEVGTKGYVVYTTVHEPYKEIKQYFKEGGRVEVAGWPVWIYSVNKAGTTAKNLIAGLL